MIGFGMCMALALCFVLMAVIFAVLKEKSTKLISGFNGFPKYEQERYDRARMAKDMRNDFALWAVIMLVGAVGSYVISGYVAVVAYVVWLILFFKGVHLDAHKAFEKYLLGSED